MYSTPGTSQSSFSIGFVTRSSTSFAVAPDEDIDHRHDDLRLFLTRQHCHRSQAEQDRGRDDERRQLRADEGARDFSGQSDLGLHWTFTPSFTFITPSTTMRSPSFNPDRTSTFSP
jgi:hypothetical protein